MSKKVKQLEAQIAELERKLEQATAHVPRILDFDVLVELMQKDTPWKVAFTGSKRTGLQIENKFACPRCSGYLPGIVLWTYCERCGQKLDWNDLTEVLQDEKH